jgi:hypothetical protein
MTTSSDVAIIGAGPHGLAAAAHLRRAGVEARVFGEPMGFWKTMPAGMFLRSNWSATCIGEYDGELSLDAYQADTGERFGRPVPLDRFIDYGLWVQRRVAPDVDNRLVERLTRSGEHFTLHLNDGDEARARRVVVACGIAPFARRPEEFSDLPGSLVSHTGDHADLSVFGGRRVAVVGSGQSALESAALMHEAGARVDVFARSRRIVWLKGVSIHKRLGPRLAGIVYAPTDVGPLWYSRLVAVPALFRRLPRGAQTRIAARSIRPAGSHWVRERLPDVPIHLHARVVRAAPISGGLSLEFADGARTEVDHLLLGTGYQVDIARYPFIGGDLLADIRRVNGYPLLARGLESTVPGLHFLGAPASWSFGPIMRFVSGSWYGARELTRHVAAEANGIGALVSPPSAAPALSPEGAK